MTISVQSPDTFAIGDATGPRKDTAIVLSGQTLTTLFDADNPASG